MSPGETVVRIHELDLATLLLLREYSKDRHRELRDAALDRLIAVEREIDRRTMHFGPEPYPEVGR